MKRFYSILSLLDKKIVEWKLKWQKPPLYYLHVLTPITNQNPVGLVKGTGSTTLRIEIKSSLFEQNVLWPSVIKENFCHVTGDAQMDYVLLMESILKIEKDPEANEIKLSVIGGSQNCWVPKFVKEMYGNERYMNECAWVGTPNEISLADRIMYWSIESMCSIIWKLCNKTSEMEMELNVEWQWLKGCLLRSCDV